MYELLRRALFALPAEASHEVALAALRVYGALPGSVAPLPGRARDVFGLRFRNPVGLAAGLDKDARAVEGLARLGFGFVEVGTVTPRPQPGNPRPRLFRLPQQQALINRMGFNSAGVEAMVRRLGGLRERGRLDGTLLGVNVGKNRDTPLDEATRDYARCMEATFAYADYLTLNLSSPNTPGLRNLQSAEPLRELLGEIRETRERLTARYRRRVPVLLKIAPDLASADLVILAESVAGFGIDGLIATNTTVSRPGIEGVRHASEAGGLSGAPLRPLALETVRRLRALLPDTVPVVGAGGVLSADDGRELLAAGAALLQIYTGFIYRGPSLLRELSRL
jgi:dihydroorotate dehydrogenase